MKTPQPYRELRRGNTIIREFSGEVDSRDLVWHQDRSHRRVTVLEGAGWCLQTQEGLPFALVEGDTHSIRAKTWHRLVKGQGNLRIKILESEMRITESQLRQTVRKEILRYESAGHTAQPSESYLLEVTLTAEYQGKTYKASPGVIALLKKYNWDGEKAIADGKFDWAKKSGASPYAIVQAATIVGTGKPLQRKKATEAA